MSDHDQYQSWAVFSLSAGRIKRLWQTCDRVSAEFSVNHLLSIGRCAWIEAKEKTSKIKESS
jgi:hypothetical protein